MACPWLDRGRRREGAGLWMALDVGCTFAGLIMSGAWVLAIRKWFFQGVLKTDSSIAAQARTVVTGTAIIFVTFILEIIGLLYGGSDIFHSSLKVIRVSMAVVITWKCLGLFGKTCGLLEDKVYEAGVDFLTGVANRKVLFETLEQLCGTQRASDVPFAILLVDLDGFKSINDTYGHSAGDSFLRVFASIMKEELREGDVLARYGGDEFAVIVQRASAREAATLAGRIKDRVGRASWPFSPHIGLSCGIAEYPTDGTSSSDLMRVADRRMYEEKTNQRLQ